jgi:hypothetical protein
VYPQHLSCTQQGGKCAKNAKKHRKRRVPHQKKAIHQRHIGAPEAENILRRKKTRGL